jgi:hypothetical protein
VAGSYNKNQHHARVQVAAILREFTKHAQPAAGGLSAQAKYDELKRRYGRSVTGQRLKYAGGWCLLSQLLA